MRAAARRAGVKMHAYLDFAMRVEHGSDRLGNLRGRRQTHGIRKRDLPHAASISESHASDYRVDAPRLTIRISEGHGKIGHHIQTRVAGQR